ncbi:MAG: hypothetical protein HOW73_13250 [Polyangiaceae bacterium]|nr:hypothetical protein [Polyangiaceae bacterium]
MDGSVSNVSDIRASHAVSARALWAAVDVAKKGGISTAALLEGLSFDEVGIRRLRYVDWSDYVTVVERVEELAGGPEACARLLERQYHQVLPELQALARAFIAPKALVRVIIEVINPKVFHPVECRYEDLGGDCIRVRSWLRPGARPCAAFFRGSLGACRGMTRHLGLPAAELLTGNVGPRSGSYDLLLPPSRTIAARVTDRYRSIPSSVVKVVLGYKNGKPESAIVGRVAERPSDEPQD